MERVLAGVLRDVPPPFGDDLPGTLRLATQDFGTSPVGVSLLSTTGT